MIARELCCLHSAAGRIERCPGPTCPLWTDEAGRAGCVLAGIDRDLAGSPGLASYLLELRLVLEQARTADERVTARSAFHRRLNEEQDAEA